MVWDEFGNECQRFYLHVHDKFNKFNTIYPYSPYHLSDYSFSADLMYLGLVHYTFFILPSAKETSFMGSSGTYEHYHPAYTSSLIMRNASKVWLLGGLSQKYPGEEHRTRILDLR